jgi:hypothetical protein
MIYTPTHHHVKTLAATSSRPNPKILVAREVLAHPHVMFHPCTCGICGDATVVAIALIGYDGARSRLERGRGGDDIFFDSYSDLSRISPPSKLLR